MIVLVLAVVALVAGSALSRAVRAHGAGKLLCRFFLGLHLDGRYRTDAGWLRPGVRVLHPTGHASRWSHLPRLYRAGIRWAVLATAASICAGFATDATATLLSLAAVGTLALAAGGVAAFRAARGIAHVRRYVRPLHVALAPALGIPRAARPQSWITVPQGFTDTEGAQIRLALPEGFLATAEARAVIAQALKDKLAIEDSTIAWQTVGRGPAAVITTSSPPPARVPFAAARDLISAAGESAPVIGLGRRSVPVTADYDADSPHVLISAGTGGGKSTIVRGLLAQGLHHGALGIICDIKRISHTWARGLPNVCYSRSIPEIHHMLLGVKAEVERRCELVDMLSGDDGALSPEVPRLILVMEEMNATASRLAAYWRRTRAKGDPPVSPAVEALADILCMGRAVRINVIAVAQMMTVKALGGPEARENFAVRILGRYTLNSWRMLVPEVWPAPRSSRHAGRVQVAVAGTARETQVVYFGATEAREWALSGRVARYGAIPGAAFPAPAPGPGLPEQVTLREACERGILTVSLDSARAARRRDPEFPSPVSLRDGALMYHPGQLVRWQRNRPRAGAGDREDQDHALPGAG